MVICFCWYLLFTLFCADCLAGVLRLFLRLLLVNCCFLGVALGYLFCCVGFVGYCVCGVKTLVGYLFLCP